MNIKTLHLVFVVVNEQTVHNTIQSICQNCTKLTHLTILGLDRPLEQSNLILIAKTLLYLSSLMLDNDRLGQFSYQINDGQQSLRNANITVFYENQTRKGTSISLILTIFYIICWCIGLGKRSAHDYEQFVIK